MPQREFWTQRHATEIRFALWLDPATPDGLTHLTCIVKDQAGADMAFGAGLVNPGFSTFVMADAVKAALEAFEASSPQDVQRAFTRTIGQWKRAIKDQPQR